ncbi:hypothetical protein F6X40_10980 [Paraburkholderia sp. UCT31]|uniref:hypothetical protein n=1 Tax=Paraburkholderia sp. UCT31 TaxID=2615209 RepID=UPI00165637F9|nr:hypothetical protein [Paraburkholderia sp. UCT31]MBC8737326.1 hypothetical protein [Paraburkholderia sp. UCT31]
MKQDSLEHSATTNGAPAPLRLMPRLQSQFVSWLEHLESGGAPAAVADEIRGLLDMGLSTQPDASTHEARIGNAQWRVARRLEDHLKIELREAYDLSARLIQDMVDTGAVPPAEPPPAYDGPEPLNLHISRRIDELMQLIAQVRKEPGGLGDGTVLEAFRALAPCLSRNMRSGLYNSLGCVPRIYDNAYLPPPGWPAFLDAMKAEALRAGDEQDAGLRQYNEGVRWTIAQIRQAFRYLETDPEKNGWPSA